MDSSTLSRTSVVPELEVPGNADEQLVLLAELVSMGTSSFGFIASIANAIVLSSE